MAMPSISHRSLGALCIEGRLDEALHILRCAFNPTEDFTTYFQLLQSCVRNNELTLGKNAHSFIVQRGFPFAATLLFNNKLIHLYVRCGSLHNARNVFDLMKTRDLVSWNRIVTGVGKHGCLYEAITLLNQMQRKGFEPDQFTIASIFAAIAKVRALNHGMSILQSIYDGEFLSNVRVATALVDMQAKCGSVDKARELFDRMPQKNVVSWNVMIAAYARSGFVEKALETFKEMRRARIKPDSYTFCSILAAYAKLGNLKQVMNFHESIKHRGLLSDVRVVTSLVDSYAKCGMIRKARDVFNTMQQRNGALWTTMIVGYVDNGLVRKACLTFRKMRLAGVKPNKFCWYVIIAGCARKGLVKQTLKYLRRMQLAGKNANSRLFSCIVTACAKKGDLGKGMETHRKLIDEGIFPSFVVSIALIDMYAKCGSMDKVRGMFDQIPRGSVVPWTALMAGYVRNGYFGKALETFKQMRSEGVNPSTKTFACILVACAKMRALKQGMEIHQSIMDGGFLSNVAVATALVTMYAKCADIDKAHEIFGKMPQKNVVSWNAMIAGYVQNGLVDKALGTFEQMQLTFTKPNSITFLTTLSASAKLGNFEHVVKMHECIKDTGYLSNVRVATALVDVYGKCGRIDKARQLFDAMRKRDASSWNAMIAAYAQNRFIGKASKMFKQMLLAGVKPNSMTIASISLS